MTDLSDRQKVMEAKFAVDNEFGFKVEARACKIFGLWLGEKLGYDGAESQAYGTKLVTANLEQPGFDDVKQIIMRDIADKNLELSEQTVDEELENCLSQAREQLRAEGI